MGADGVIEGVAWPGLECVRWAGGAGHALRVRSGRALRGPVGERFNARTVKGKKIREIEGLGQRRQSGHFFFQPTLGEDSLRTYGKSALLHLDTRRDLHVNNCPLSSLIHIFAPAVFACTIVPQCAGKHGSAAGRARGARSTNAIGRRGRTHNLEGQRGTDGHGLTGTVRRRGRPSCFELVRFTDSCRSATCGAIFGGLKRWVGTAITIR